MGKRSEGLQLSIAPFTLEVSPVISQTKSASSNDLTSQGPAGDYNHWEELGNSGWGYKDVEPYFAKSETTHSHPSSDFRGKQGEIVNA